MAEPHDKPETRITIAANQYGLLFEDEDTSPEIQEIIASDITLNLAHLKHVQFRAISRARTEPSQKYLVTATHWLDEGKQSRWFPEPMEKYFGGAVEVGHEYKLIVHRQLIEAYKQALQRKEQHPAMFSSLPEFLALLQDRAKLEALARDKQAAEARIFIQGEPPVKKERLHKDLTGYADFTIRRPSVLDIVPLGQLMGDPAVENVFVFSTLVTNKGGKEDDEIKIPLGAYKDGRWQIWVAQMP